MVAAVAEKLSTGGCASRARAPFSIEKGLTGRVGSGKPNGRWDSRRPSRRDTPSDGDKIRRITRTFSAVFAGDVIHRQYLVASTTSRLATATRDPEVTTCVTHAVRHAVTDHG